MPKNKKSCSDSDSEYKKYRGKRGYTGEKGCDGEKGDQGEKGDRGEKGSKGTEGERGEQGDKGDKGEKGDKGDKGDRGEEGRKGDTGPIGHQGDEGCKGDKGNKGDKGEKGDKGDRGDKGDKGERGLRGCRGEQGYSGEKGEKGEKGDKCCSCHKNTCENTKKINNKEDSYVWAIKDTIESVSCSPSFQNIIFTSTPEICGWSYNKRNGYFTCDTNGKYIVSYNVNVHTNSCCHKTESHRQHDKKVIIVGAIDDCEIIGSDSSDNKIMHNNFIINIKCNNNFSLQFLGAEIITSASLTIIKLT